MKQLEAQVLDDEDGEDGGDGNADLDWDALATYEKFESYVAKQAKPGAAGAARRPQQQQQQQQQPAAAAPGGRPGAKAPASAASAGAASASGAAAAGAAAAAALPSAAAEPELQLDKDLDELEQLIKLFELADKEAGQQQQLSRPSARAGKQQQGGDEVDWETVEKMLLGESWDQELLQAGEDGSTIDVTPDGAARAAGARLLMLMRMPRQRLGDAAGSAAAAAAARCLESAPV
jgi:hypothetical protein